MISTAASRSGSSPTRNVAQIIAVATCTIRWVGVLQLGRDPRRRARLGDHTRGALGEDAVHGAVAPEEQAQRDLLLARDEGADRLGCRRGEHDAPRVVADALVALAPAFGAAAASANCSAIRPHTRSSSSARVPNQR